MKHFDLTSLKARYDMRAIYPESPKRRNYSIYTLEFCIFHDDQRPSMLVGKDWYKCRGCGAKGDVISWAMQANPAWTFVEAVQQLEAGTAGLHIHPGAYKDTGPRLDPPTYQPTETEGFVAGMTPDDYAYLEAHTSIKPETARLHQVGRYDYGIFTIPIRRPGCDEVVDLKIYRPDAPKGEIKTWHYKEGATDNLYGTQYLNGDSFAVILAGEKDTILGHQMHLPTVTNTSGEGSWKAEFNQYLNPRTIIYAFLDADISGRRGMARLAKLYTRIVPCDWRHLWRPDVKKGFDFHDFVKEGGTREMFLEMLRNRRDGKLVPLRPSIPVDPLEVVI